MTDDLKAALRSLRSSPTFTAVALTVLALGIGAGTAIFSVVDAVVLRALPFDEHDRLAVVLEYDPTKATTFGAGATTPQTYLDWRRMQDSFDGLAHVSNTIFRLKNESGEPGEARGLRSTWEFLPMLRVKPLLGRTFTVDDEVEGRHRVVLLSYGFWQRRFGGSPDALGKTIELSDQSWEIVGVMPRDFAYPVAAEKPTELYVPMMFRAEDKVRGGSRSFNGNVIGRLRNGVSLQQANDQMHRVSEALDRQYPKWGPGRRARVITLQEHLIGRVRSWMLLLLGAVGLVLLIACANVANLMLARATVRGREIGIRAALGAGRWRLVRGLLIEGLVLSLTGAAIGVLLAYAGVQTIRAWLPAGLPRVAAIGIDLRVLFATIATATVSGIFFGVIPALQASKPDLTRALKDSGRSSTAGAGTQRLRGALVIAEVALAVMLLVGAGLFIGSFVRLMRVDTGVDYHNVLVLDVSPPQPAGKFDFKLAMEVSRTYVPQMLEAVRGVPGVEMASTISGGTPLTGSWSRTNVKIPGRGELNGDDDSIDRRTVSPDYLRTLRIPILRGRNLEATDNASAPGVVVINDAAARKYFPNEEALGKRMIFDDKEKTIVGIAGNVRGLGPESPPRQEAYLPFAQDDTIGSALIMRTAGDPMKVLPAVKAAIWNVNKEQRLTADAVTLEKYMERLIAQRRFNMALLALFGGLGLVIAAVGIYGVMAYIVAQRTNEIGVRMALGATRGNVVSMVLKRAGLLMGLGLVTGCAGAWYLSVTPRIALTTYLFETQPNDLWIFGGALITLAVAGLIASAVPALRAASVDPLVALRTE
jgi:putative ABC transport system permease protein